MNGVCSHVLYIKGNSVFSFFVTDNEICQLVIFAFKMLEVVVCQRRVAVKDNSFESFLSNLSSIVTGKNLRMQDKSAMLPFCCISVSLKVASDDIVFHENRSEEHTSELQSRQYLVCR